MSVCLHPPFHGSTLVWIISLVSSQCILGDHLPLCVCVCGGGGSKEGHWIHQAGNTRPSSSRFVNRSSRRDGQEENGKVPGFKLPPDESIWA